MALLEPSLADGIITDSEATEIISEAEKSLTASEVLELKLLLGKLVADSDGSVRPASSDYLPNSPASAEVVAAPAGALDDKSNIEVEQNETITWASEEGLFENLSLTAAFESFKGPMALGDHNDNRGVRIGVNWGYPLWAESGLGVQLGTAATFANFDGRQFGDDDERNQSFTTTGFFQRSNGFHWAFAHDFLLDDHYLRFNLHQWRGEIGYELSPTDEIGIWAATGDNGDRDDLQLAVVRGFGGVPVTIKEHRDPLTQGNLYWRHLWYSDAATRIWIGAADEHGCVVGGDAQAPLGEVTALVVEANYLSDEIWNVSVGIAIYPGRTARYANTNRFAPVLPVANNGTFAVDRP
jgi:hypothetical protein